MMNNEFKKHYAVIGDPIAHSKSPQMQNAAFLDLGISADYHSEHVKKEDLANFAEHARKDLAGFNVTVPHKENIIAFLDGISEECQTTRSVNTVKNINGKMYGESTDGYGLEMAVKEAFGVDLKDNSFMFLGCGGTVNAVAYHFLHFGAKELFIVNRTVEKAEALCRVLNEKFPHKTITCSSHENIDEINKMLDSVKVVIQATSLGLKDDDPSPLNPEMMRPQICMFDTIYKNTAFLQAAENCGCKCTGGQGMLVHQGAKSFEIWTGIKPSIEVMRSALN